ncbi:MAG: hypothetical protein RLZZ308_140 [Candidatus Parcubacteria bacterium]|jgi:UDP-N-acetylmuramate dehydrogenase
MLLDVEVKNVTMKNHSSIKVGGSGVVHKVSSLVEVIKGISLACNQGKRVYFLGEGTNSYFGEDLSAYLFIQITTKGIFPVHESESHVELKIFASENWDTVVMYAVKHSLYGIENLSYIPGSAGAAPVQNIGAYGVELSDVFVSCEVFDCEEMKQKTFTKEMCHFGYRDSIFKQQKNRYCILSITISLRKEKQFKLTYAPLTKFAEKETLSIADVREEVLRIRKEKLPDWKEFPNCGSFFKNPIVDKNKAETLREMYPTVPLLLHGDMFKIPSAWLIEHVAEMKGVRRGSLYAWPKQSLVIVNDGEATADDVDAFAREITDVIFEKTGIRLEQEVNRVG